MATSINYGNISNSLNILNDTNTETLYPFVLKATFGFRKEIGIRLTLNKHNQAIMVYCMSNIICLYNINEKTCIYNTGHAYRITRLELSSDGRVLVSIDTRNVHIWDLKCSEEDNAVVLRIIKDPFGRQVDVEQVAISPCSKYLILVSRNHKVKRYADDSDDKLIKCYKIQIWDWSYDRDICEDMIQINENYGTVNHISFDCNEGHEKSFVITFDEKIIFVVITADLKLSLYKPVMSRWNAITRTIYMKNTTLAISITTEGKVILWDDGTNTNPEKQGENMKNLYKVVILKEGSALVDISPIDNYIVIIDTEGDIGFYDESLKLMYSCTAQQLTLSKSILMSIRCGVFRRKYEVTEENIIIKDEYSKCVMIPREKCIQNYNFGQEPFIVRNFFLVNEAGELAMIDIVKKDYQILLIPAEDYYVAMDIYPQKPWMIGCTKGNWFMICNYETNNAIAKYYFKPKYKPTKGDRGINVKSVVTCINVPYGENFIAVGYDNGSLCMIDPVTAKETHEWPMVFTDSAIRKMAFKRRNNNYGALADDHNALVFIFYNGTRWEMLGKFQYHCMPIIGIFFLRYEAKNYLITVGYDRMYVRYKINVDQKEPITPEYDVRLDQAPKLTAAQLIDSRILSNDTSKSGDIIIVANNQFKFVFYDAYTAENLFTFLGPIYESPIQKIIFCPSRFYVEEPELLLFTSKKSMGAAILPLDGNPFRYSGILAHHTEITSFQLNHDLTGVLIHGEGDVGPTYWDLKRENMYEKLKSGGKGLEPFLKLLPGGKFGHFFQEMIQFFYYIQLMQDPSDAPERKTITESIKLSEIIDFMRAIGFFPSEYEAKNLMNEVTRTKDSWAAPPTHLSFTELIKLYFNHRPADGYRFGKILDCLKFLLSGRLRFAIGDSIVLNSVNCNRLLDIMTNKGEKISQIQGMRYLLELLDVEDRGIKRKVGELNDSQVIRNFKKLPEEIHIHEFCYKVFGMESTDAERMINIFEKTSTIERGSYPEEPDKSSTKDVCFDDSDSFQNNEDSIDGVGGGSVDGAIGGSIGDVIGGSFDDADGAVGGGAEPTYIN